MKKGATFVFGQTVFGNNGNGGTTTPAAAGAAASNAQHGFEGESMRAKAHTSIIDYAFENMFLQRERSN